MMTTIAKGEGSGVAESRRLIVRDADEWRALWALHAGPEADAPPIDFSTQIVAAAFAGERPSAGYEIAITGARQQDQALDLVVEEWRPSPGAVAAQMIVTPFHIVSVPRRFAGNVRFEEIEGPPVSAARPGVPPRKTSKSGARATSYRVRAAPSSTGLAPHMAAALAYLAGPFSGILVLLAERTSRFVRFHAWQSLLGLGGVGLLSVVFLLSAFAALLVSPSGFTVMYWLAFLTAIGWVILWAVCLVLAFNRRSVKLPLVGKMAERRAARTSDAARY
jgi:uncharacterized membrane protein